MEDYSEPEYYRYNAELYNGKKNIAIILIDVGPSMFENETKAFKRCIGACFKVLEKVLLRTYRKNICVCLMRDDNIVLTKFTDNLVDSAKKLLDICKTKNEELKQRFERAQPVSLRHTLTECLKLLPSELNKVNPYVVLLTNNDDPHAGDQKENLSAFDIATSFKDMNACLAVLPLKDNFDFRLFYTELMKNANALPLEVFDEGAEEDSYLEVPLLIEMLNAIICDTMITHRHEFEYYEKKVGTDTISGCISVQMSYYAKKTHLYRNCTKSRTTGNLVKREKNSDKDRLRLRITQGSKPVIFDKSDQQLMHMRMRYGFRLLYITADKQSTIHRQKHRNFIIQSDEMSTFKHQIWFDHMWEYCSTKNRYVVAGFNTPGYKQSPRIVELSPTIQQNKRAFIGHFLINCDEINRFPASITNKWTISDESNANASNDPTVQAVCDLIDDLTITYEPRKWKDPKYEQKAVFIRAQLLDNEPESFQSCIPTKEAVEERAGESLQKLKSVCPDFFPDRDRQPPKKKARTTGRGRKRGIYY